MKRLSTILGILMLMTLSIQAQKTYVLLTGVSNYGDPKINLSNTTKDVKRLAVDVFEKKLGITPAMITSKNANHDNIVKRLNAIIKIAKPEDKIIFYFSGHGSTGGFVPSDRSFFNYQELIDILKKAKAKNVFCFIDACMSGSAKSISANNFGIGRHYPHIFFMSSSDASELSGESSIVGHGYFTKSLIKGLKGMSDKDKSKSITINELFNYCYNDVVSRTRDSKHEMHPQLLSPNWVNDVIIIKY